MTITTRRFITLVCVCIYTMMLASFPRLANASFGTLWPPSTGEIQLIQAIRTAGLNKDDSRIQFILGHFKPHQGTSRFCDLCLMALARIGSETALPAINDAMRDNTPTRVQFFARAARARLLAEHAGAGIVNPLA